MEVEKTGLVHDILIVTVVIAEKFFVLIQGEMREMNTNGKLLANWVLSSLICLRMLGC